MATIADLKTARAAAGAAYVAAAQAYLNAWVELAAYDKAVSNAAFTQPLALSFGDQASVRGHGEFLQDTSINGNLVDRVAARNVQLIQSVTG